MKVQYDQRAVKRFFEPGDLVLALMPIPGRSLQNRFTGPYVVKRKVNDVSYVVQTPERRRALAHINMLKPYHDRNKEPTSVKTVCTGSAFNCG